MKNIVECMKQLNHAPVDASGLSAQLECFVGCYFLRFDHAEPDIQEVYFDAAIDKEEESVDLIPENLVAYVTADGKYAFVLERVFDQFIADTAEYSFRYIPVTAFDLKEFWIDLSGEVPELFQKIAWIDDSFLYDEHIAFDFEAYFKIDDGIRYINPRCFSIHELITFLREIYRRESR